jgi:hypothetical protein
MLFSSKKQMLHKKTLVMFFYLREWGGVCLKKRIPEKRNRPIKEKVNTFSN